MNRIARENIKTLEQTKTVVNSLSDQMYTHLSTSSIGQHIRHILDHYLAVQQGYDVGYIDYNARNRNSNIESDRKAAINLIDTVSVWIKKSSFVDKPLVICTEVSVSQTENVTISSNLSRELCYLLNHSIHHLAYIKLLAKSWDISFASDVGVAPSTASYLRQQNAT